MVERKRERKVNVGTIVLVVRDDKTFLMCQRTGSHGAGTWSCPGGWMRHGETPEQTADREVFEETGVIFRRPRIVAYTNDIFPDEDVHSVTLWVAAHWYHGEGVIKEPNKCTGLRWVTLNNLPSPLFLPFDNVDMDALSHGIDLVLNHRS
jgi:8-oxo-dGTP diphosphatase